MPDLDTHLEVAGRLRAALDAGDAEAYAAMFEPDAVIWHNYDEAEMTPSQSAEVFGGLATFVPDAAWEDERVVATPEGFVTRSIFTGTGPGGTFRAPTCVVVTLSEGGRIARLDEYLDAAQLAPLMGG